MAAFKVTASELKAKVEQLQTQNQQFQSLISEMKGQEEGLRGMWEGDAQKIFQNEFTRSAASMENFYKGITQYIQALQEIIATYERAEAQNVETASVAR